jgi:DNA-binding SARP family transcriptional activator
MQDSLARVPADHHPDALGWPILVCVLGGFRLLKAGVPVRLDGNSKGAALLATLALRRGHTADRESVLQLLWPNSSGALAGQSLNSLVYNLHKLLGDGIGGAEPVERVAGGYRLNRGAGVGVDVTCFDEASAAGDRYLRTGQQTAAIDAFRRAVDLYQGDVNAGAEPEAVIQRERLRARYLTLLARLGDDAFVRHDYAACLEHVHRMLVADPCREDAHRLAMRCYARLGERTQALRQYRLCESLLRSEFDAAPEAATVALFQQAQRDPASVLY